MNNADASSTSTNNLPNQTRINPRNTATLFPPPRDFARQRSAITLTGLANGHRLLPARRHRENHRQRSPNQRTLTPAGLGYIVDHLFDDPPASPSVSSDSLSDSLDEFVTLEDSSSESEAAEMPVTTRRRGTETGSGVVDLTASSSSRPSASRAARSGDKRSAEASSERPSKRRAVVKPEEIEDIDLTEEAPSVEEELRQQQQRESIKAQQAAQESEEPQRIGQRQCIICMENYTNASVSSCGMCRLWRYYSSTILTDFPGHFFCHECLTQALIAGEKSSGGRSGNCPVCRKTLTRTKKHDIIPIAFMTKAQFAKNQRKRTDILA